MSTTVVKSGNQIINITTNELNQKLVSVSQAPTQQQITNGLIPSETAILAQLDTCCTNQNPETPSSSSPTNTLHSSCDLLSDTTNQTTSSTGSSNNSLFNSSHTQLNETLVYSSNSQYTTLVDLGSSLFSSIDCDTSYYTTPYNQNNSEFYMQQTSNLLTPSDLVTNQAKLTTFTLCSPNKNIIDDLQQQQQLHHQHQLQLNQQQQQQQQHQNKPQLYYMHQETSFDCDSSINDYDNHQASHIAQASPVTAFWLVENFEPAEGCSLRRSDLYTYYLHHCKEQNLEPVNPASFGKLIRSVFCGLRTRRLGTRGNSKYHYYGIRVKASSLLNNLADDDFTALKNHPMSLSPNGGSPQKSSTNKLTLHDKQSPSKRVKIVNTSNNNNNMNLYNSHDSPVEYKPVINENIPEYTYDKKPILTQIKSYNKQTTNTNNTCTTTTTTTTTSTLTKCKPSHLGENQTLLNNNNNNNNNTNGGDLMEEDFNLMLQSGTMPQMPELGTINCESIQLNNDLNLDDVKKFETIYKDHLEKMFHLILKLKFSDIEHLWHSFWRSNQSQTNSDSHQVSSNKLYSLCQVKQCIDYVREADYRFYQFCIEVLIPDVLDSSKKDLVIVMRNFCRSFNVWLANTLTNVPDVLREIKLKIARSFCLLVKQYSNLIWLISAFKSSLKTENQNLITVGHDFNKIDFNYISEQMVWMCGCDKEFLEKYVKGFKELFVPDSTMNDWFSWMNDLVSTYLKPYESSSELYIKMAKKLYSSWSLISSCAFKDLTLRSAKTFGNIVFFQMVLDEYMLYMIQDLMAKHSNLRILELLNETTYSFRSDLNQTN